MLRRHVAVGWGSICLVQTDKRNTKEEMPPVGLSKMRDLREKSANLGLGSQDSQAALRKEQEIVDQAWQRQAGKGVDSGQKDQCVQSVG